MKAGDKQVLYNLLKTSDFYLNGYTRTIFQTSPQFTDDSQTTETVSSALSDTPQPSAEQTLEGKSSLSLTALNNKIIKCTRCSLCQTKINYVVGLGVENPLVLVVGETPSYEEDIQGKPFAGAEGELLDKMLEAINLGKNTNCYLTNIVKCRPSQSRAPTSEELKCCSSFLEAQIKVLKPKMILCFGRTPFIQLTQNEEPLAKVHGQFYEYNKIPLLATYHPAVLLKKPDLKRPAWEDLKIFKQKLSEFQ